MGFQNLNSGEGRAIAFNININGNNFQLYRIPVLFGIVPMR